MTTRRQFFQTLAATAAIAIIPTMDGIRLLRTRLARGDVRELIQYHINTDQFIYRCDVLFRHRSGVLLRYAEHPRDLMVQFNTATEVRYDVPIGSKAFHAGYRLPAHAALESAMKEHGIGVYDLITHKLPIPQGIDSPEDWVARQDYDQKRNLWYSNRKAFLEPKLRDRHCVISQGPIMAMPQPPFQDASIQVG